MDDSGKLGTRTKLIYGVGDVGNAVVNSAIQFFLMIFYTDAALIGAGPGGQRAAGGQDLGCRQRPTLWLALGPHHLALRQAAGLHDLWRRCRWRSRSRCSGSCPAACRTPGLFIWIAGTFVLFDTVWTLTNVPYYALTAELTDDYDERSSLTAYRMVLGVPAYIVGAAAHPGHRGAVRRQADRLRRGGHHLWGPGGGGLVGRGRRAERTPRDSRGQSRGRAPRRP